MEISLVAAAVLSTATALADTVAYTMADTRRELPEVIVVEQSRVGVSVDLDTVRARGGLGDLARANWHFVTYLTVNAPSAPLSPETLQGDLATVRRRLLERLDGDTVYLQILTRSVQRLRATRTSRAGEASVRQVPFGRVLNIATRFFYPEAIGATGRIEAYACVGINGLRDIAGGRDLAVEAFAYAAIFHDLMRPVFDIDGDFGEAVRLVNGLDLGTDPEVRLQRARGAMWAFMARSEKLTQVLRAEFERAAPYLPFAMTWGPMEGGVGEAARTERGRAPNSTLHLADRGGLARPPGPR